MWSKIYLACLGLSLAAMSFFTFYAWSWLQSIGRPETAAEGYDYHAGIAWPLLWITTIGLLLLGNAVLWTMNRSWALWVTFVYFAVIAVVRFFWLDQAYLHFRNTNSLADDSVSLGPFLAVIMIAVMAAIVFFDQFLIVRLKTKMQPPVDDVSADSPA